MNKYEAIGIVEAKHFTTALNVIDIMCKQCRVELLCTEKYLGGMLVSTIVAGDVSNVTEAIEGVKRAYKYDNELIKNAIVITRPHENIMKFIVKGEEPLQEEELIKIKEIKKEDIKEEIRIQEEPKLSKPKVDKVKKEKKTKK